MGRACLLALVIHVAAAGTAAADDAPDAAYTPRLSVGLGVGDRIGDVAGVAPAGLDLHAEVEARLTAVVSAIAGYDVAWVADGDPALRAPVRGRVGVVTVGLHDAILAFGASPTSLGGDLFVEAGVGRETTRWADGTRLARTIVSLGLGGTVSLPRAPHAWFQRVRYGFRIDVARAPDPLLVPLACDGPCDQRTRTSPYDTSFTLELLWHVGR